MSFCFLNLIAFVAAVSRPTFAAHFRYASRCSSLLGFLFSFIAMAWAISQTPEVGAGLAVVFMLLLGWKARPLLLAMQRTSQWDTTMHSTIGGAAAADDDASGQMVGCVDEHDVAAAAERVERAAISHACTYPYIYTHTHTYTHIHIHTHTYTYIPIHTHAGGARRHRDTRWAARTVREDGGEGEGGG